METIIRQGQHLQKVFVAGDGEVLPGHIEVAGNASLDIGIIVLPGISMDIPMDISITGENAEVHLSGIFVLDGEDKVSLPVTVRHEVPGSKSDQLFNCIASGNSTFDFFGKIIVVRDAQKTESYQTNRNILLSEGARVNTKPQLEIYADDVLCSHGATIGRLNEEEQFYMRSRGIPEKEAKVLQMLSFISPVLSGMRDTALREDLMARVEKAIRLL